MPRARVKKVIDRDTVQIMNDTLVRIAGYNALELNKYGGKAAR